MEEALKFWLMKPLAEALLGIGAVALALLVYLMASLPGYWRQRRCDGEANDQGETER